MRAYDLRILSLGAGTQSSALLMLAIRGELPAEYLPLDAAIFADTGDEPQEVYDWLRVLEREAAGKVPIHVVRGRNGQPLSEWTTGGSAGGVTIPAFVQRPDGTASIGRRKCTEDFKIAPIRKRVRDLLEAKTGSRSPHGRKVLQLIGMSVDEAHRMKPSHVGYIEHAWPLIDMRWRRSNSIAYIERLGLGTPPRSACVYCPFHSDAEWRRIRDTDPDGWKRAVEFDAELREYNRQRRREVAGTRLERSAYAGDLYLHRSLLPLAQVDLSTEEDHGQGVLWDMECEGMCGS